MNIAFPALVVTLLVLPGILFRYAYRKGFFARSPSSLSTLQDEVASGILGALILNGVAVGLVSAFSRAAIGFEALLALLAGWPPVEAGRIGGYLDAVAGHASSILTYLLCVNGAGLLSGYLIHAGVRRYHLDLRYDFLRFNNEWYYTFSGEARVFDVKQEKRSVRSIRKFLSTEIDFVFVSIVVSQEEGAVLYWGVLNDYFFDTAGRLDKIVLESAQRRSFADDEEKQQGETLPPADKRFYKIRGSYLVIRQQNIRTLNVGYKLIDEAEAGGEHGASGPKTKR